MYSDRLNISLQPNPLTVALRERRARGDRILDLTRSNPLAAGLEFPEQEILSLLNKNKKLQYDPAPLGLPAARAAIARYYEERGVHVPPAQILLTASTSEAYSLLFKLLANPIEHISVPSPSYPLFDYLCLTEGLVPLPYCLEAADDWRPDFTHCFVPVDSSSNKLPRALVVVHPNNPTGSLIPEEDWDSLLQRASLCDVPIICDEVFVDYVFDGPASQKYLQSQSGLIFVLNGLSKTLGLPQLKLSWIVVAGDPRLIPDAVAKLEVLTDLYLSVATPVQEAVGAGLLDFRGLIQARILDRIERNRRRLSTALDGTPMEACLPEAGWYAMIRLPFTQTDEEWALEWLASGNVLVHPGSLFGLQPCYVVVSLLGPEEEFCEALESIAGA